MAVDIDYYLLFFFVPFHSKFIFYVTLDAINH